MSGCNTYKVNIYIGLKEGYDGSTHHYKEVIQVCREYTDKIGLGVTVTPTHFVYTDGDEPGVIVGLINYPRFPKSESDISHHGFVLGEILMKHFKQHRCTVELPDVSLLMENDEIDVV